MIHDDLHTAHLIMEPLTKEHFPFLRELHSNDQVMKTLGGERSDKEIHAFIKRSEKHWKKYRYGVWALRSRKMGHQLIGRVGLLHTVVDGVEEVELLYALMPEFWGKGLTVEACNPILDMAFGEFLLPSVVAFTLPKNKASIRVMEKLGFAYEKKVTHADLPHVLYLLSY